MIENPKRDAKPFLKRPLIEVPMPPGATLPGHSGTLGRNSDHTMTVTLCGGAFSNFRVIENASLGYLGEAWLLPHVERAGKDGPAMMFAEMRGERFDENCVKVTALAHEIDGKLSADEVVERVRSSGKEAFGWTTHNHRRTRQHLRNRSFQKWHAQTFGQEGNPTDKTAAAFCAQDKKYDHLQHVRLVDDGRLYRLRDRGGWFDAFGICHDPEDKYRIVFPLKTPILVGADASAKAAFKAKYHAYGRAVFGEAYSTESCTPGHLHYLPSHMPGQPFSTFHLEGELLDPETLQGAEERCEPRARPRVKRLDTPNLDELARILQVLPPDLAYPDWYKAIAAVFHETGGSGEGNELIHDWSSGDPRYDFDQVERIWDSLDPDHPSPCTIGTLRMLAGSNKSRLGIARHSSTHSQEHIKVPILTPDWRKHINKSTGV